MTKYKTYKKKVPIVEVFRSIQGEGKTVGVPSIFVRFWGCNLRCQFKGKHCDTPYAVINSKDKAFMNTPFQTVKQILSIAGAVTNIVFTGGEPMLYQEYIKEVMYKINQKHAIYTCEIETNGTIETINCFSKYINQFNISPKLSGSNQETELHNQLRINNKALKSMYLPHKAYFKFVVSTEHDLEEIKVIEEMFPKMNVYLMPEGVDRKTIIKNSKKLVNVCIKYGYKFSPREHILIWDKQRGV